MTNCGHIAYAGRDPVEGGYNVSDPAAHDGRAVRLPTKTLAAAYCFGILERGASWQVHWQLEDGRYAVIKRQIFAL